MKKIKEVLKFERRGDFLVCPELTKRLIKSLNSVFMDKDSNLYNEILTKANKQRGNKEYIEDNRVNLPILLADTEVMELNSLGFRLDSDKLEDRTGKVKLRFYEDGVMIEFSLLIQIDRIYCWSHDKIAEFYYSCGNFSYDDLFSSKFDNMEVIVLHNSASHFKYQYSIGWEGTLIFLKSKAEHEFLKNYDNFYINLDHDEFSPLSIFDVKDLLNNLESNTELINQAKLIDNYSVNNVQDSLVNGIFPNCYYVFRGCSTMISTHGLNIFRFGSDHNIDILKDPETCIFLSNVFGGFPFNYFRIDKFPYVLDVMNSGRTKTNIAVKKVFRTYLKTLKLYIPLQSSDNELLGKLSYKNLFGIELIPKDVICDFLTNLRNELRKSLKSIREEERLEHEAQLKRQKEWEARESEKEKLVDEIKTRIKSSGVLDDLEKLKKLCRTDFGFSMGRREFGSEDRFIEDIIYMYLEKPNFIISFPRAERECER